MDFSLVEISGPPNANNHSHHIGDRNKLAKALKQQLKKIRRTITDGDVELYEAIKLFEVQVYGKYQSDMYVQEPVRGVYVFDQVMVIQLLCPIGMITTFMPKLVKDLWKLKVSYKQFIISSSLTVTDYLNSDGGNNSSDCSTDSRDIVYISPTKRSRKKRVETSS
ncbi:hypothetical protein BDB00DRAFT_941095 [Zychaea mexicana]|uniref:uncharacterized protein n=1 Tax=Zychaea mexicana TaxID=64656 RepID=UPI0022FE2D84|nr:uncharacterized protein BDB00DRAFT_941095 [Zychaea mexicana]KAI9490305.1 hypothetical protein BDB00DRAFT_941095 [Zychaea mexicana]